MGTVHPKEKDAHKVFLSRGKEKKKKITVVRHLVTGRGMSQSFGDAGKDETDSFKATGVLDTERSAQMRGPAGGGGRTTVTKEVGGVER